jgi:hypothetical protein
MLAMLMLNLLLFLSLRDKSHVWYLLYTSSCPCTSVLQRLPAQVRLGSQGDLDLLVRLLCMGCFISAAAQFGRSFLFTDKNAPKPTWCSGWSWSRPWRSWP